MPGQKDGDKLDGRMYLAGTVATCTSRVRVQAVV